MQRIKIEVSIQEEYEWQERLQTRDVTVYEQRVTRTGEPNDNADGLIAAIARLVNEPRSGG